MRLLAGLSSLCLATVFALGGSQAQAYTPEGGLWWNPSEPGSGYTIEIQDNLLVLSYYGGDAQGRSTWYTAVGFLSGNALLNNTPLDLTIGSQCVGCAYNGRPTVQQGAGGTVRVAFDANDSSKATLTWGNGRSVRIERYKFYLKRPEDSASVPLDVTRMLGEWQLVLDFSESNSSSFDYYGDVLVFDQYSFDGPTNRWYFEGCRADNSEDGGCSNNALAFHSAAGFFDNASGLHATVVDDSRDNYALYLADMGTNSAEGEVTVYPKGRDPDDYAAYPMRTFRTASRTFVQEGVGPAKAAATGPRAGLGDKLIAARGELAAKQAGASKFDRAALAPLIRELEAKLEAKRAAR